MDSIAARVVCISRETGADGETVGRVVAERLGLQYVDEEVIARAAERGGVDEEQLADAEQRKSRIRRVIELLTDAGTAAGAPGAEPASVRAAREEEQRALIRAVIDEIAAEGNAVIVAHAASMALAGAEGILRVLVTASPEERVKRLVETEEMANADAARLIMESDQARADYFRAFLRRRAGAADALRPGRQHRRARRRAGRRDRRARSSAPALIALRCVTLADRTRRAARRRAG